MKKIFTLMMVIAFLLLSFAMPAFAEETYTVTDGSEATEGSMTADPASGETGTEVKLTAIPAEGYKHVGWQLVSGGGTLIGDKYIIGTDNAVIKALFKKMQTKYDDWDGTVEGKATFIDKYFVVSKTSDILDVDFTYTLSLPENAKDSEDQEIEGVAIEATDTTPAVYVGINPELVKIYDLVKDPDEITEGEPGVLKFSNDEVVADVVTVVDGDQNLENTETKKHVKKTLVVDFSMITFKEPGIYRYYITEESSNPLTENDIEVTGDNNLKRTIDVYVFDDETEDHVLTAESYIVYEGHLTTPPKSNATPYDEDTDFDIEKNASGNNITTTTWTYIINYSTGEKNEYVYNAEDHKWELRHYIISGSNVNYELSRDISITDIKGDALGATGKTYTVVNYKHALELGATNSQIRGASNSNRVTWIYTEEDGTVHEYIWDFTTSKWLETTTKVEYVEEPEGDSKASVKLTNNASNTEITYAEARANQQYVENNPAAPPNGSTLTGLRSYTWIITDTTTNTVTKFEWDTTQKMWKKTTTKNGEGTPVDEAIPNRTINVTNVRFAYVLELEKEAQGLAFKPEEVTPENGAEAGKKSDRYVNRFLTQKLEVRKTVTGNQGSRDKFFKFTILIDCGEDYKNVADLIQVIKESDTVETDPEKKSNMSFIHGETTDTTPNAATSYKIKDMALENSKVSYTTDGSGQVTIVVYLQDGEHINLKGIPQGSSYTVKEEDYAKEGYKTTAVVSGDTMTNDGDDDAANDAAIEYVADNRTIADTHLIEDAKVEYTNDKSGVIPTGVLMSITGGLVLIGIATAAIIFINRRRAQYED